LSQLKNTLICNTLDRDEKVRKEAFKIIDLIFEYDPMYVIDELKDTIPEQKFKHILTEEKYEEFKRLIEEKRKREEKFSEGKDNLQESITKENPNQFVDKKVENSESTVV